MTEQEIESKMFSLATQLICSRYKAGWGGAAVICTDKESFFTSVPIETANASAALCIEVGAMCEAHKYNERVTHCLCVVRDDENAPFKVLSPCGICQERLRFWGDEVMVGVTSKEQKPLFVPLKKLQPYHWTDAYDKDELEHYEN